MSQVRNEVQDAMLNFACCADFILSFLIHASFYDKYNNELNELKKGLNFKGFTIFAKTRVNNGM